MKFLFRVPLLDFDPNSLEEIKCNWPQILLGIQHSSPSLFEKIKSQSFQNLSLSDQKKVYKYILRGRFRSTPFGYWAAVGVGFFGTTVRNKIDLSKISLLKTVQFPEYQKHTARKLAAGGQERMGRIEYLSYVSNEERWTFVSIPKNPLSQLLANNLKAGQRINFSEFQGWFKDSKPDLVEGIWEQLCGLGILFKEPSSKSSSESGHVDLVINDPISLPGKVLDQLTNFFEESGNLFSRSPSFYIEMFQAWFEHEFDDRFVPLPMLLNFQSFVTSSYLKTQFRRVDSVLGLDENYFQDQVSIIDLKKAIPKKPIDAGIYDLSFLFRAIGSDKVFLENLVCNKPFSYVGRFNRDERIYSYQKEVKEKIFRSEAVIYAELIVYETNAIQGICNTRTLFDYCISPFELKNSITILLEDLELGIREGAFILYHNKTGRRVVPVVTHPLNGKEISHPLMRLLWEVVQQDNYKLDLYQLHQNQSIKHLPEYHWGNLIIQGRKWFVNRGDFQSRKDLYEWMAISNLPSAIKVGVYDRELVLETKKHYDGDLLWDELNKYGKMTISDPLWLGKSEFKSTQKKEIYPEFVTNISREKKEIEWKGFINSIKIEDKNSLYFLVRINPEEVWDFLRFYFSDDLKSYLETEGIKWFYIVYPEDDALQIRIRFLRIDQEQKRQLLWLTYELLAATYQAIQLRPYYPETKKYGERGYKYAEDLFHLESELLSRWICGSSSDEVVFGKLRSLVYMLWKDLLPLIWPEREVFVMLQTRAKQISHREKRIVPSSFLTNSNDIETDLPWEWFEKYRGAMLRLIEPINHKDDQWRVVRNIIHMQVNRFFPLDRRMMEVWIYLKLYKELGQQVYRCSTGLNGKN
ncbi:lantibiotic dehydratase [Algoriphagus vanfongensis]|uniref:lantibiotic dehydratase n=1 Tax=Algoriphagus vanfongensis TaxID=426371 RepID=UPI0003FE38AB|nr:lantibiotic dehydratase [Algoriphagus vanfongensis]